MQADSEGSPETDAAQQPSSRLRWGGLLLAAILLAGLGLRTYGLHHEVAWYDELPCLTPLAAPNLVTYIQEVRDFDRPMVPVYFVSAYAWSKVFGQSVYAMRLLSVLFGMLTLVLLYQFTRARYGPKAALFAAACLAVSIPHIYYSQEIRVYSLVSLLSLASAMSFLRVLQGGDRRWWLLHLGINALLLWTHLFAALMLVVEGLCFLAFRWREVKRWFLWGIGHAPAVIPLALWTRQVYDDDSVNRWITPPTWGKVWGLVHYLSGTRDGEGVDTSAYMPGQFSPALLVVLALSGLVVYALIRSYRNGSHTQRNAPETTAFLLAWCVLPGVLLLLLSWTYKPCLVGRYMLHCALPFCILAGAGFSTLRSGPLRAGLLLVFPLTLYVFIAAPGAFRVDWQAGLRIFAEAGYRRDAVLATKNGYAKAIDFNANRMWPPVISRFATTQTPDNAKEWIDDAIADGQACWVYVPLFPGDGGLGMFLKERGYAHQLHVLPGNHGRTGLYHVQTE
jgi:4-amino-4-deoxy-L-arabinose transferase-like glycosyltransferase